MYTPLPPLALPTLSGLAPAPVQLRPMTLADNAAAFVLSEIAFGAGAAEDSAITLDRQARWENGMRAWFGWLQAQGEGMVATVADADQVIGYARVVREAATRHEQLTEIFVHPAFQRAQVGKALLGAVLPPAVAPGWQRIIYAHPAPAALALYYRWGVLPTDSAWYLAPQFTAEGWEMTRAEFAASELQVQVGSWQQNGGAITRLDRAICGVQREALLRYCAEQSSAALLVGYRGGMLAAFGVHASGRIGPVVGAAPENALALLQGMLLAMRDAGDPSDGIWVPGANHVVLRWLRQRAARIALRGQIQIMASDPARLAGLDRMTLTAPAYVF